MRSRVIVLMFSVVLTQLAQSADAQVIFSDDFSSYTAGDVINLANSRWQPKWQGNTDQQNLFTAESTGEGYAVLDTSVATRNYNINGRTPFTMQNGDTVTISADVRYFHEPGGNITENLNSNFIGLQLSTTPNWWDGTNKSASIANRGPAIGNSLSMAPWIEGWQPHNNLGVDTATGGYSNWLRLDWELTVNGSGNIEGVLSVSDITNEVDLYTSAFPIDLGYLPGDTLYAGLTTDWNNAGADALSTLISISEVNVDNYQIEGGELVATPGDIDGDLDVDGADFIEWQRGTPPDPADLTAWQNAYGGALSSISAVPEPTSLALCFLALSVGAGMRRSRS